MADTAKETVILIHGIGNSAMNMAGMERALRAAGYETVNITYPSLRHDIPSLAVNVGEQLRLKGVWDRAAQGNPAKVHFVTHSMGGVVTARYLQDFKDTLPQGALGHVVMLAPPLQGSEVADGLKDFPPYKWIYGPAGQQLTTAAREGEAFAPPYYKLGIIAGDTGWPYMLGNIWIHGAHDGRVAVERTKIEGMTEHITMPATHTGIAWKKPVQEQVVHFLQKGVFGPPMP